MGFTPEQQEAIKARGKVLVSASAGAGKTTVMIKRLADILEEGASLDDVLAVTFTKKAAAQMKTKLRGELIDRLNGAEGQRREHIRTQLNKINCADISTIHSFCARLIRTYFYALKVDSSFDVVSGGAEENTLKAHAMDDLFQTLYTEENADLYCLLEKLKKKRSDKYLKETLFSAYEEVRIRPDYVNLLKQTAQSTYTEQGFLKVCEGYADKIVTDCLLLITAIENFEKEFCPPVNKEGYLKVLGEMRQTLLSFVENPDIFNLPIKLATSSKPKVKPETAECDGAFTAFCDGVKKRFKGLFKDIDTKEVERERFFASGQTARAFINLILRFDEAYSGVKAEEGKLDYSDLEHFALKLLSGEEGDEDVRGQINDKYKFVFVDEYQDVNPIQDKIISLIAHGDIFCVGDIKQAIYGFRGSRSRFFADKCAMAQSEGKFVVLPDNFRSGEKVINFVNALFSDIMNPPLCKFAYADGHAMRGGMRYGEKYSGLAEICLFDNSSAGKEQADGIYSVAGQSALKRRVSPEGVAVLTLIEEALSTTYFDPDLQREVKVGAGDICVLTRKKNGGAAQEIIRAVSEKYPVAGATEANICDRPEIKKLIEILKYLDNGEQDVPLACALLSPLGGFKESELAKIRLKSGAADLGGAQIAFRECVKNYAQTCTDEIAQRINGFFARVKNLKKLAQSLGAARLIDEILRPAGFAAIFDTEQKISAVRRLQKEAYSGGGELQLNAFLNKIKAAEYKIAALPAQSSDCVKVMTMHASKGLEFPVVIIADIAAEFKGDDRCEMPFDDEFGFAPRYFDKQNKTYCKTLLRKLCKVRADSEELSNEINLFYVACTRAKYALHVLCGRDKPFDKIAATSAVCYADLFDVKAFTPRILPCEQHFEGEEKPAVNTLDESRADKEIFEKLSQISSFKYGYKQGVELPVKSSASRILSLRDGEDAGSGEQLFKEKTNAALGQTGIERGLAYHRYLELCDFTITDAAGIQKQIENWVARKLMTKEQAALLETEKIQNILAMPAFNLLIGKKLYREREFLCKLPSADYASLKSGVAGGVNACADDGNAVILQGAIDLLAVSEEGGRAVAADIIDYKFTGMDDGYVSAHYAPQLALYKSVVCRIYNLSPEKVCCRIINIFAARQIEMGV